MLYLVLYNGFLAAGWAYVLFLTANTLLQGDGTTEVYKVAQRPLKIVQTAAVLEVVHATTGLVRSPVLTTAIQVFSRIWALWGIVNVVPDATTAGSIKLLDVGPIRLQLNLTSLLVAWSISEVLRYTFYVFKELKLQPPYPLLWLRYSAFIILYPVGVASELTMAYLALPTIHKSRPLSCEMPNRANISFDYHKFCLVVMLAYVPGLPQLYLYMLSQRKKLLGSHAKKLN